MSEGRVDDLHDLYIWFTDTTAQEIIAGSAHHLLLYLCIYIELCNLWIMSNFVTST